MDPSAEMEGPLDEELFQLCRFNPTPLEAVAFYLPRLISGGALHGAERLIHRADVYGEREPRDLAAAFAPAPKAEQRGDRFFFTLCKRQKGSRTRSARAAGAGTWTAQQTNDVEDAAGVKVGEVKNLSFKKRKKSTGWVMEEYRCLLQGAAVDGGEMVLCRIHLSPNACAQAREESAAYLRVRQQEWAAEQDQTPMPVGKRPADKDQNPPCPKRARASVAPVLTTAAAAGLDGGDTFASSWVEEMLAGVGAQDEVDTHAAVVQYEDDNTDSFNSPLDELLRIVATEEQEEGQGETIPAGEAEQHQQVFDLASDDELDFDIPSMEQLREMMLSLDDAAGSCDFSSWMLPGVL